MRARQVIWREFRGWESRPRFAVRTLAGFDRIHLRPAEGRTVSIHIPRRSLQYWSEQSSTWKTPESVRDLFVGPSWANLPLRRRVR
jgi:beta-glucosidase